MKEMLNKITHGDQIVTTGGIHGKITGITDQIVTLEIAEKTRIKISRSAIAGITQKATQE